MQLRQLTLLSAAGWIASTGLALAQGQTLTIATVNNADMIIMQRLSPKWEQATGNKLNWVVLEENVLRQRVTTDIATNLFDERNELSRFVVCSTCTQVKILAGRPRTISARTARIQRQTTMRKPVWMWMAR